MRKKFRRLSKKKKFPHRGHVNIRATFNNTLINIGTIEGDTLVFKSTGGCGYSGTKKKTKYAARAAARTASKIAYEQGMRKVALIIKGPGRGRESSIRGVYSSGLKILKLKDVTPFPHNGCRPPKKRRV